MDGLEVPTHDSEVVRHQNDGVAFDWYPKARIVDWTFRAPTVTEEHASALEKMKACVGDVAPYTIVIDCTALTFATSGYRRRALPVFAADKERLQFLVFGFTPVIRVMVDMFMRVAGLDGGCFPSRAAIFAHLGVADPKESASP